MAKAPGSEVAAPEVFWLFQAVHDAMIAARYVVAKHRTMPGGDAAGDDQSAPQVLERLVEQAERAGASDIHLHMREGSAAVAFRLDGVMTPTADLPAGIAEGGGGFGGQLLRQGSFAAGAPAVGAALAGIFDDMAEGMIVAEPLEKEVPQRDERRIGPLIKGPFGKIQPGGQPGGRQELGEVALELAGGKAGAQQLGRLGLLAAGLRLWLGGRLSRVGFGVCHECMYYDIHTYHARPTPSKATVAKSNRLPLASQQRLTGQGL
jgi:hypothetical protein